MKKNNYHKILLSAYVDGELSHAEKHYIEEKLKSSLELQKELSDLKKIKNLTSSSLDRISDSPFFETRLFANLNAKSDVKFNFKKWIPVAAFTLVAIALMFFLKFTPTLIDDVIEEQKTNIAGFYKQNLQPLFYAANLTNEDIFNFAINQELPLDKSNRQILKLGYDEKGKECFEIKITNNVKQVDNLKKFAAALELNDEGIKKIDSIVGSYNGQISKLVLVNDKNSVAINPSIWKIRKVILADILTFAKKHASSNYQKIMPETAAAFDDESVVAWVNETKSANEKQYIFCTPDSIFKEDFVFDFDYFNKGIEKMSNELAEVSKHNNKSSEFQFRIDSTFVKGSKSSQWSNQFEVHIDTNIFKVVVHQFNNNISHFIDMQMPDFDSIFTVMQEATKNFTTVSPVAPESRTRRNDKRNYDVEVRTNNPNTLKRYDVNLDSLMHQQNMYVDSVRSNQLEKNKKLFKKDDAKSVEI